MAHQDSTWTKKVISDAVAEKTLNVVTTLCFIHREALSLKTLQNGLKCTYNLVIKIVNYMKSSASILICS